MYARLSALLLACLLAVAGLANAQETTSGSLGGQINDPQSLAVPGVTVTVSGPQGQRVTVTDADGRYLAPFLVPGVYSVRAELQGFKAAEQQNITVSLGQRAEVNLRLETGGLTETVQVTAESTVVDTRSTTVGGVLDSASLVRLPVGRLLTDSLYLVPGVSDSSGVGRATPVDRRRQRSREQLRHRRREHHRRRVRRDGLVQLESMDRSEAGVTSTSSRKRRSRPAASRPSSARPAAASSTS